MKRFLLVLVLALAAIGALVWLRGTHGATTAKPADLPIPVATAIATARDVPITLEGIGTVQALNTVNIRPQVDGPLAEVRFREGQEVHAGDVLARIDPRPYQATYDQAVAKKAQDEATLANARLDLNRYQKLARTAYATEQQADTQKATVAQDEALVRQDQASIDSAKTNLDYCTIRSPVEGRTGIRQVDVGNIVHNTDTTPITVVTTLQPITVVFTLPQQTLPDVTAAMAAGAPEVVATAQGGQDNASQVLDASGRAELGRGHVEVLDNQVDQTTGTIKLRAIFPNRHLRLWPGAFVTVLLSVRVEHGVTTVPTEAIQRGPAGAFVYVVGDDGRASRVSVTVPHQDEALAVVSTGLKPGQTVVTEGASRVEDGRKVKTASS